jgi:hypothetical protein
MSAARMARVPLTGWSTLGGSDWIFYGKGYTDERGSHQRVEVLYGEDMRWPVPRDARTSVPQAKGAGNSLGRTRICLHPHLGLGVVTFWKTLIVDGAAGEVDALGAKLHAGAKENQKRYREALKEWGFRDARIGRITTVLTVQVDTDDLDDFVSSNANAENIGRLFTGDEELERSSKLAAYATDADVSGRKFERIYVRWTDALAVYDTTTKLMDPASMRVVRLVETGILIRRLLRETAFEAEEVMKSIRPWTFPWLAESQKRAEYLRRTVAEADLTTSVAPPIHSVEGTVCWPRRSPPLMCQGFTKTSGMRFQNSIAASSGKGCDGWRSSLSWFSWPTQQLLSGSKVR